MVQIEFEMFDNNNNPQETPIVLARILRAERVSDQFELDQACQETDQQTKFKFAVEKQLNSLVEWAKHIPHFAELSIDDQVALLKGGWNELLIAGIAHRSLGLQSGEFVKRYKLEMKY